MGYLIDTNILIRYFAEDLPYEAMEILEGIFDTSFNISFVNRIEVLGYSKHTQEQFELLVNFFTDSKEFLISEDIIQESINLKRSFKLKTPDAIIAATAIQNGLVLVTNDNDFQKAKEDLEILDPLNLGLPDLPVIET